MSYLIPLRHYRPLLDMNATEQGIKVIKEFFADNLSTALRLRRVTAPLFVLRGLGINDDLSGKERAVNFPIKDLGDARAEVVHSLAKWKRLTLAEYDVQPGYGIYTDMNAIRADEELGNLHSLYVDQWDWERVIRKEDRSIEVLEDTVQRIFTIIKHMQHEVWYKYPDACYRLPREITFIDAEELLKRYPTLTPKERETAIARECGAVFVERIGGALSNGEPHDLRAPDYDDWNLNGDILFWFEPLQCALELSSMGIRVSPESLDAQLKLTHCENRRALPYHKALLNGELPYTIGGGIGQSRLCMLLLGRAHVGEVQASIWPEEMIETCAAHNITLL